MLIILNITLRLLGIGAAVPYLERVVLPLIIRPKGGGYYTRAALIRVRNLLQRIRYFEFIHSNVYANPENQ